MDKYLNIKHCTNFPHMEKLEHTLVMSEMSRVVYYARTLPSQRSRSVARCSRLVTFFRKSSQAVHVFHMKQEALDKPKHKVLQKVDTWWSSTYDMIECVINEAASAHLCHPDRDEANESPPKRHFRVQAAGGGVEGSEAFQTCDSAVVS